MNTTSKLLSMAIILGMLMSCSFSGITGSRNVIKEKRELKENIEKVKVSTGI
ncbi:MAG: hypothetical protein GXO49_03010, partial [Chlorobi bacterium]|nr:hypothetical protein [Chlorobiota bacterium]